MKKITIKIKASMGRPEIETIIRAQITGAELPKPVERKVTDSMILEAVPVEERTRTQELSLADIEVVTPPPLPKETKVKIKSVKVTNAKHIHKQWDELTKDYWEVVDGSEIEITIEYEDPNKEITNHKWIVFGKEFNYVDTQTGKLKLKITKDIARQNKGITITWTPTKNGKPIYTEQEKINHIQETITIKVEEPSHEEQLADIGKELRRVAIESELPKPGSFDFLGPTSTEPHIVLSSPQNKDKIDLLEPINFEVEIYNMGIWSVMIDVIIKNLKRGNVIDRAAYVEGSVTLTVKPEMMEVIEVVQNSIVLKKKIFPTIQFKDWVDSHKGFRKWQIDEFLESEKFVIKTYIEIETKDRRRARIEQNVDFIKLENRPQFLARIINLNRRYLEGAPFYLTPESIDQTLEDLGIKRKEEVSFKEERTVTQEVETAQIESEEPDRRAALAEAHIGMSEEELEQKEAIKNAESYSRAAIEEVQSNITKTLPPLVLPQEEAPIGFKIMGLYQYRIVQLIKISNDYLLLTYAPSRQITPTLGHLGPMLGGDNFIIVPEDLDDPTLKWYDATAGQFIIEKREFLRATSINDFNSLYKYSRFPNKIIRARVYFRT